MGMNFTIGSEIRVHNPTPEIFDWCKKFLTIKNPEFEKRKRLGLWTGNTPKEIRLYWVDGSDLVLPYGVADEVINLFATHESDIDSDLAPIKYDDYPYQGVDDIPLYDYQIEAVETMMKSHTGGILQAPAGSGKTQIGLALIGRLGQKALWITHTKDLLQQSMQRASQFYDSSYFGTITEGKVEIGRSITFATIQTLAKVDLSKLKKEWNVIVVDECHRVAGSPAQITQFGKVLSSLAGCRKYGLSATVHRADGLIKSTFAYLGEVIHTIDREAVADKIMDVGIERVDTGVELSDECLDTDGTIIYSKLIDYLSKSTVRNYQIADLLALNVDHYNLILSDRVSHLEKLKSMLPDDKCCIITGKMTSKAEKAQREQALDDMRNGNKHFLFATYKLAKEGLDIPRLDRLYLTTPQKDYAIITQSIGRIARSYPDKCMPIVYDFVDSIGYSQRAYAKRRTVYKKNNCIFLKPRYQQK